MTMNPAHTVRLHYVVDCDTVTGHYDVASVTTVEPTPAVAVKDTGKRVFQCDYRDADTVAVVPDEEHIVVRSDDGPCTTNVYLTRESAREMAAALFALADG